MKFNNAMLPLYHVFPAQWFKCGERGEHQSRDNKAYKRAMVPLQKCLHYRKSLTENKNWLVYQNPWCRGRTGLLPSILISVFCFVYLWYISNVPQVNKIFAHILNSQETQCRDIEDTEKLWKVHHHHQQPQLQKWPTCIGSNGPPASTTFHEGSSHTHTHTHLLPN